MQKKKNLEHCKPSNNSISCSSFSVEMNLKRSSTISTACLNRGWTSCPNCSSGTSTMAYWRLEGGLREGSVHTKCPRLLWMPIPGSLRRITRHCASTACILAMSRRTWTSMLGISQSRREYGEFSWWRWHLREASLVRTWTKPRSCHSCNI